MKRLSIIGLLIFFVLNAWAQETNKPGRVQPKEKVQIESAAETSRQSQMNKIETSVATNTQENVIDYQQAGQSPRKIQGTIVENTVSGDKRMRQVFGSAFDSGRKQKMAKPIELTKCTQAELKSVLPADAIKIKPVRIPAQNE